MNETPRTDAEADYAYSNEGDALGYMVDVAFARELERENAELRRWKAEMLQVESEWDVQALAKLLGGTPGQSCRKTIAEKVPELLKQVAAMRTLLEYLRYNETRFMHADSMDFDGEPERLVQAAIASILALPIQA